MARSIKDMLRYEASRKPEIADILDRLDSMSDADLDSVKLPLPWYRVALREIKKELDFAAQSQSFVVNEHLYVEYGFSENPEGELIEWIGETAFISVDRGMIDILKGRYLFMPYTGGFYHANIFSKRVDPAIYGNGRPAGKTTLQGYREFMNEFRTKNAPIGVEVLGKPTLTPTGHLGSIGVRFR